MASAQLQQNVMNSRNKEKEAKKTQEITFDEQRAFSLKAFAIIFVSLECLNTKRNAIRVMIIIALVHYIFDNLIAFFLL